MRFLCVYKPSKPEGTRPTREDMAKMGQIAGGGESENRQVYEAPAGAGARG